MRTTRRIILLVLALTVMFPTTALAGGPGSWTRVTGGDAWFELNLERSSPDKPATSGLPRSDGRSGGWLDPKGKLRDKERAMKKRLIVSVAVSVAAIAGVFVVPGAAKPETSPPPLGNHSLKGVYEFHADGVVEVDGQPTRGFWEAGRFEADGNGNMINGVEYSSMLSSDEAVIDQPFTFSGTYSIRPDGTAVADVTVQIPGGTIQKKLWFVIHSVGRDRIADGFAGGHSHADLGGGTHGNARVHEGNRIQ